MPHHRELWYKVGDPIPKSLLQRLKEIESECIKHDYIDFSAYCHKAVREWLLETKSDINLGFGDMHFQGAVDQLVEALDGELKDEELKRTT